MTTLYPDGPHGFCALVAEFIRDPDFWSGRNRRTYGRQLMRDLADCCIQCHFADVDHARVSRMHAAYGRRKR